MPTFIEGFLLVLMIFSFCIGIAIIIKLGLLWLEQNKAKNPPEPTQHKIYLVKQTPVKPKTKPRKKRSPKVAFEGLILKPENVLIDDSTNQASIKESHKKADFHFN